MKNKAKPANTRLDRDFFDRDTLQVAQDLIGKEIRFGEKSGIITETEAYRGTDDPASHAYRKRTPRNDIMFRGPGFAYVYFTYGMHNMLNFITEKNDTAAAVLIRGIKTKDGLFDGPAKLTKYFGITRDDNNTDIVEDENFGIFDTDIKPKYENTTRIGISNGEDLMWRFVVNKKDIDF
ncbi:MAG: DNA-3-methyladenine glycosylase [Alphaproteobacteria bacterium]|nr:DNA-3-methyladenine glycosylase [Alphaproteobacteria bacterium]